MNLRKTLKFVHALFKGESIDHALIGALALSCYGSTRATADLNLLIHQKDKERAKELLLKNAFNIVHESENVMQFSGLGYVDLLIARRTLSQKMLENSRRGGPEGINFAGAEDLIGLKIQAYKNDPTRELQDKADIQYLVGSGENLDWDLIKKYAELFDEWENICEIKKLCELG